VAINRWLDEDRPEGPPQAGPVPRLLWDNTGDAAALTSLLLVLGHRRLGVVNPTPSPGAEEIAVRMNYHQRHRAVDRAAAAAGCPAVKNYTMCQVADGSWRRDGVTAFFGPTDDASVAADIVQALARQSLAVPRDASVVSFADVDLAEYVTPRLTTATIPFEESGRVAGELGLRFIRGEAVEPLTVLPCPVVERESCARPAPGAPPPA
jgi:DNA-binding LacI/PurR family transcriptional regulator